MNTATRRVSDRRGALISAAALAALLVAAPIVLIAASTMRFGSGFPLAGVPAPDEWERSSVGDSLSAPLRDDTIIDLVLRVSLVGGWVAVIVIIASVVLEVLHRVRHDGIPHPTVRGLGWSQPIARSIASGLLAVVPLSAPSTSIPALAQGSAVLAESSPVPTPTDVAPAPPAITGRDDIHVVQRGESVYGIAEDLAEGDDRRVIEIAEAILDSNLDRVMVDGRRFTNPALILPGWELRLPADERRADPTTGSVAREPEVAASEASETGPFEPAGAEPVIEIEPGDTLSGLAAEHLGHSGRWVDLWELNRGRTMTDGRSFDDPDLIVVGWQLRIPVEEEPPDSGRPLPPLQPADQSAPEPVPPARDDPPIRAAETIDDSPVNGADRARPVAPVATVPTADPTAVSPSSPPRVFDRSPSVSSTAAPSTSTTIAGTGEPPAASSDRPESSPTSQPPIQFEHAAFLAGGIVALLGVRRRARLRSAAPRTRIPAPRKDDVTTERRLRSVDPAETTARLDISLRSAAVALRDADAQIVFVVADRDGSITLHLSADADPDPPWVAEASSVWVLPASVPIEIVAESARGVGAPCLALVQVGVDRDGRTVLLDLEAAGSTSIDAPGDVADDVVRAIALGLASSPSAESVHLVAVAMGTENLLGHPNAHRADDPATAVELARSLAGSTITNPRRSFDLRSRGTGGELWEPAVVLLIGGDIDDAEIPSPDPGHGLAVVKPAVSATEKSVGATIAFEDGRWTIAGFGHALAASPVGVSRSDALAVIELVDGADVVTVDVDAASGTTPSPSVPQVGGTPLTAFTERPREIVVSLVGPVEVRAMNSGAPGSTASFQRSKTVELIAWLATHRERSTRGAARTALWEIDVRDATFANVVSEARRGLGRLVEPPEGEEWIPRTMTEALPLHDHVVTDADLIEDRVHHARLAPPDEAIDLLRPAVELIRGIPFEGTSYVWPDADGLTSNIVLLATTASAELAGHALSIGDIDLVFWATGQGLKVLPGHEELIGLRMRAHARAGDLAGVRHEWESYERVVVADTWSDGEPAPKLVALRRELLSG